MQQTVHIVSRNHSEPLKNNYEMGEKNQYYRISPRADRHGLHFAVKKANIQVNIIL